MADNWYQSLVRSTRNTQPTTDDEEIDDQRFQALEDRKVADHDAQMEQLRRQLEILSKKIDDYVQKKAMADNPVRTIHFSGRAIETTVASRASVVDNWVRSINPAGRKLIVGLDCEWRPNTSRYTNNMTALLQLCVGTRCLIVQLFHLDYIPQSLRDFLRDPNHIFVGVEVASDVARLDNDYGLGCTYWADVRGIALERWPDMYWGKLPGLKDLAERFTGIRMEKPEWVCRSDWQRRFLTEEQVEYACIDAFASCMIGHAVL